tara:strand:+ start:10360 stop:10791 length:432 start_codon:yes stop_codon:yes gene_type:complete
MPVAYFLGSDRQQVITKPNQIISAWCLVSPSMSLFPTPDDEYQILPVEATLVRKNLAGEMLSQPESLSIKYVNPHTGMDKYEIIPMKSPRFNVRARPSSRIVYQELDNKINFIPQQFPIMSSNILGLIFATITLLSITNNRNN